MMLIGRIAKETGPWWSAECEVIGAFTQGRSRKDAAAMLADCIEAKIGRSGLKVTVTELRQDDDHAYAVLVAANEPASLAVEVLKYQREVHHLTLADVAKKLGASSINSYAAYEQGKREPSLSKYLELLGAVAPDMALTVAPKTSSKRKARAKD
jgi:DNA-binding XRE family transcriptional regulator